MVDVSEQFKNNSDSFKLPQNVDNFGKNVTGSYYYKINNLTVWIEIVLVYMFLFLDAANCYSDYMSEKVDMVEVKTEPTESDELFSVCKNTNMVDNHSRQDEVTSESKIYGSIHFKISIQWN